MFSTQVWHGSLKTDIVDFLPLTHFGTKLQAYRAIIAHAALDNWSGTPCLYECSLSFDFQQLQAVADMGSPSYQAIYFAYCKAVNKGDTFHRNLRIANSEGFHQDHSGWICWIRELTLALGHRLFSYNNAVEGPGLSYCVLDSTVIKIIKATQLSWKDVATFHYDPNDSTHGFNGSEVKAIDSFLLRHI